LNVTGCRGPGQLSGDWLLGQQVSGDWLLLHATSRCALITHLDTSWTNVNSAGLQAAADNCHRYLHSRPLYDYTADLALLTGHPGR